MEIPTHLTNQIRRGKVVLFLGSGASKGAIDSEGNEPPNGKQLSEKLFYRFLDNKNNYENQDLSWVSELSISEANLFEVQDFIKEIFCDFEPADFHMELPTFKWRALVTTNYDKIIEKAYNQAEEKIQELAPFITNKDRVDYLLKEEQNILFLKLHGCISNTHDREAPLILTLNQYSDYRKGRERLYNHFEELAHENNIVFIGHRLQDIDLREILKKYSKLERRPRYYLVTPDISSMEKRLWEGRNITVLEGTFKKFIENLAEEIPIEKRKLQKLISKKRHPIMGRFISNNDLDEKIYTFLNNEVKYIYEGMPITREGTPEKFYKGFDLGWYPIENNLDVKRDLKDVIIFDKMLADEEDRPALLEFIVIKAEAGAGKTVFLKRLAWDSAMETDVLCLFLKPYGELEYEPILNLFELVSERIYLFIDNASEHVYELKNVIQNAKKDNIALTIITVERINEWNMSSCDEELDQFLTDEYQLPYLNHNEIKRLVELLETHKSLGHLKEMSQKERIEEFKKRAGRQILVALHEATLGKPYEEILIDEFNEIRPQLAQDIYLSVCVLNRLNVYVRAGLISRVYGIPFSKFKERFFKPLEHVVEIDEKPNIDYLYSARHSRIAEIVFDKILIDKIDRYNEYIKLIKKMNISFSSDRKAFRRLIKGNNILKLFPDHQDAKEIFKTAYEISQNDPYVYHQHGLYEMKRDNGSYKKANELLKKSKELNENPAIIHSLAELARIRAFSTEKPYKKSKFRQDAINYANNLLLNYEGSNKYARHTLIKLYTNQLEEILYQESPNEMEMDSIIEKIESHIQKGLQEYPGDSYLLDAEADFHNLLRDEDSLSDTLKKAFNFNKKNPYIAKRLAQLYKSKDKLDEAIKTIESALDVNPNDNQLNFEYAMLLRKQEKDKNDTIIYHLKRSFTKWDENYEAQFWYARFCFVSDDEDLIKESKEIFRKLREAPIKHEVKTTIKDKMRNKQGEIKKFAGILEKKKPTYGFIKREGYQDTIFIHKNNLEKSIWDNLFEGKNIKFGIGFQFKGPIVVDVEIK